VKQLCSKVQEHSSDFDAEALCRTLVALARFRRDYDLCDTELSESLLYALEVDCRWTQEDLERWSNVSSKVLELAGSDAVCVAAKTHDLAFDFDNLMVAARILTDIRPVFDDQRDVIVAGIINHLLRVEFATSNDGGQIRSFSLAVDNSDLKKLRDQCDRALRKSEVAKLLVTETCGLAAFVVDGGDSSE
jgi:hypothetical protein